MSGTTGVSLQQLVQQGTLNRLRASIVIPGNPTLNVNADHLGPEGINFDFEGAATDFPPTMTGFVTSAAPYVGVMIRVQMLRTQGIAGAWQQQFQQSTVLGTVKIHTDVTITGVSSLTFRETAVRRLPPFRMDGRDPYYPVELFGAYLINADLLNIA